MKFEGSVSEVDKQGDIQENKVSIDEKNLGFITHILSTNLYSNPIESFVREIVSNGWDSHKEAGTDEPVILELGKNTEGTYFCRIQDFGVGLSEQRFNDIYKNIGSSTKRDSNEQIGGFGIGRFAALAYSDVVNITSVHDGKMYKYLMYKDGTQISIDKLYESDTSERNGLEVMLDVKHYDLDKFMDAICTQLVYFENLYFVNNTGILEEKNRRFNSFKIKEYDNFKVNSLLEINHVDIVLGKVRYPLRFENLTKSYPVNFSRYPITIKFEIGDIEVSPTREEILYTRKGIAKIEEKLDASLKEINKYIDDNINIDYTSLSEYLDAISNNSKISLLYDEDNDIDVNISVSKGRKITLNGKKYDESLFKQTHQVLMRNEFITSQYVFSNERIMYKNIDLPITIIKNNLDRMYICDVSLLSSVSKAYIRENFKDDSYFISFTNKDYKYYFNLVREFLIRKQNNMYSNLSKYDYKITKVIFLHYLKNIQKLKVFSDKNVPQSWIENRKLEQKKRRLLIKNKGFDWKENVNLFHIENALKGNGVVARSKSYKISQLNKSLKNFVVYGEKDDERLKKLYPLSKNNFEVVTIAKSKIKIIENFEKFINIENFMDTKHKFIRNIGTAIYIQKVLPDVCSMANIVNLEQVSFKLKAILIELKDFVSNTLEYSPSENTTKLYEEIYDICCKDNYFNFQIKSLVDSNIDLLKNSKFILLMCKNEYGSRYVLPEERINMIVDYVLARKLFRPDFKAALKSKKETILNIKQEENEII